MPIHVACPKCRKPLMFDDSFAGRVAQCPCGQAMTLPAAPPPPPPRPHAAPARMMPVPHRPVAPPGGGGGAAVAILGAIVVLGGVGAFVFFNRQQKEAVYQRALAERRAEEEKEKAEAEAAQRYVMVRWSLDDSVLPPEKRAGAESSKFIGIRVEVANHGCEPVAVDAMYFLLKAEGAPYGRPAPIALEALAVGEVKDGTKVSGGLAFEVPDASKAITVEFSPPRPKAVAVKYGEMR